MDSRINSLRKLMKRQKYDAVFVSSLPNITYLTNFSGFSTEDRDAFLLITKDQQYIFTHGIYREAVKKVLPNFELIAVKRENPIGQSIKDIISKAKINKFGFEAFDLRVSEYNKLIDKIDKNILTPIRTINELRINKSLDEIKSITAACELGDNAFTFILTEIVQNISEKELAAKLEYYIKSQGGEVSFTTIVAFQSNAAYPHHVPTDKRLGRNEFVLIDFGIRVNNYCSDMTRTVSFKKASPKMKKIYQTVYEGQQMAIEYVQNKLAKKETIALAAVDKIAREYIVKNGFPNMIHSLGHGIGLEVHESPRLSPLSKEVLEEGMVFSIEPGIYLPEKMGVRIEDLFAIKNNKLIRLTTSPRELIEI